MMNTRFKDRALTGPEDYPQISALGERGKLRTKDLNLLRRNYFGISKVLSG